MLPVVLNAFFFVILSKTELFLLQGPKYHHSDLLLISHVFNTKIYDKSYEPKISISLKIQDFFWKNSDQDLINGLLGITGSHVSWLLSSAPELNLTCSLQVQ